MTTINFLNDDRHFEGYCGPISLSDRILNIMKLMDLKLSTLILRFYLMMAIVIGAGFLGQWWLAILSLPVFFSALMGIKFSHLTVQKKKQLAGKHEWQHS